MDALMRLMRMFSTKKTQENLTKSLNTQTNNLVSPQKGLKADFTQYSKNYS